ncbi:hypothetical protein T484DRAFT_1966812 [Baffinella frigidus]|nr:hypothetical protein T484DRAFT_1966812 [Cryptophyta sp. CCMP2293]
MSVCLSCVSLSPSLSLSLAAFRYYSLSLSLSIARCLSLACSLARSCIEIALGCATEVFTRCSTERLGLGVQGSGVRGFVCCLGGTTEGCRW